jgi:hypothetical protein
MTEDTSKENRCPVVELLIPQVNATGSPQILSHRCIGNIAYLCLGIVGTAVSVGITIGSPPATLGM